MDQKKRVMILAVALVGLLAVIIVFISQGLRPETQGEQTQESSDQTMQSGETDETMELNTQGSQGEAAQEESTGDTEETTGKTGETTGKTGETTGKTGETTGKTGETTGKTEETTGKTEGTTGKTEGTTGKTEETTGKTEGTTGKTEETTGKTEETAGKTEITTASGVSYPISLQDGVLEITSLFQFSGINPDDGNRAGTDVGAITLTNRSDSYLEEAKVALKLSDGTVLNFLVTQLPAGASVIALSTDSRTLEDGVVCVSYSCDAQFDANLTAASSKVTAHVEGTQITLTNVSGQKISKVVVYCRSPLGDEYFGGVTYQYVVNDLPANGTATIDAVDCILGMAEVVRIQAD